MVSIFIVFSFSIYGQSLKDLVGKSLKITIFWDGGSIFQDHKNQFKPPTSLPISSRTCHCTVEAFHLLFSPVWTHALVSIDLAQISKWKFYNKLSPRRYVWIFWQKSHMMVFVYMLKRSSQHSKTRAECPFWPNAQETPA